MTPVPNSLIAVRERAVYSAVEREYWGVDIFRLEELAWDAVWFLVVGGAGGPVAQCEADDGGTLEIQTFARRYPLVVIERMARFACDGAGPDSITWTVCRIGRAARRVPGLMS